MCIGDACIPDTRITSVSSYKINKLSDISIPLKDFHLSMFRYHLNSICESIPVEFKEHSRYAMYSTNLK